MAPKEEWQVVERRIISGRGLFRYSLDERDRDVSLQCVVIREPIRDYPNKNYPREPSIYAYIEWENEGAVQRVDVVRYKIQDFFWVQDPAGQLYFSLTCMYEALQARLTAIAAVLGIPPPIPGGTIWTIPTQRYFDKILVECFNDTAVEMTLSVLKYDVTCPEAEPDRREPPRDSPPTFIPSGSPLGQGGNPPASPPYQGEDDQGDTDPFPGDVPSEGDDFPKGEDCDRWIVRVTWAVDAGADPLSGETVFGVYAPIYSEPTLEVRNVGGFTDLIVTIDCKGFSFIPQCGERTTIEARAAQAAGEGRTYTTQEVSVEEET